MFELPVVVIVVVDGEGFTSHISFRFAYANSTIAMIIGPSLDDGYYDEFIVIR